MSFQREFGQGKDRGAARPLDIEEGPKSAEDLNSLQRRVQQFSRDVQKFAKMVDLLGGEKDSEKLREKMASARHNVGELGKEIGNDMKRLTRIYREAEDMEQVRFKKIAKNFQDEFKKFKEIVRKETFKTRTKPLSAPTPQVHSETESPDEKSSLMESARRQEQEQLQQQIEFQRLMIEERESGILEIESDMNEVNECFQDLAKLVYEQGEQIDLIEARTAETAVNTKSGTKELGIAANYQRKERKRLCCILCIVVLIAAALVGMFVGIFHK